MSGVSLSAARAPFVLVIDIGTSSLRAMVYDAQARDVTGLTTRRKYHPDTTKDGGSTLDARVMFDAFTHAIDEILALVHDKLEISAVAASTLASNMLALDANDAPLTPVYLYADTRNAREVEQLRAAYDWAPIYARTGCPLHTAYLAARLLWLRETQPDVFARTARFVSLHEYFLQKLFGRSIVSHSFAAWTGMLDHATGDWDEQVLNIAEVSRARLSPVTLVSQGLSGLQGEFATRWKSLANVPWYPALGDGAVANVGSGCTDETRVAVTVGTSGAMRVVLPAEQGLRKLPRGLWMYRVDEHDGLMGGSLTDGGNIFAYYARIFQLPEQEQVETELRAMKPDAHGLTLLPFFGGERSPGYHGDARAALTGWNLDTLPVELWRASLEAVAFRFAAIFDLLRVAIPPPREIIASGGALLNSTVWVQILADVLGVPVTASGEDEASARGAALLALRALKSSIASSDNSSLDNLEADLGETFVPNPAHFEIYQRARERQTKLYHQLLAS